jgi:hypothetical protein
VSKTSSGGTKLFPDSFYLALFQPFCCPVDGMCSKGFAYYSYGNQLRRGLVALQRRRIKN